MARLACAFAVAALLWLVPGAAQTQSPPTPAQAGGVAASGPTFRVVRSVSGSKGEASGGRFVVEDPRSIFYLPQDKQVIVYFEWEGPKGLHDFEAYWKNPEGKITTISEFKYEAKAERFGGYWMLTLSDTMETGLWALEAHVDGEIAGTHAFQILKGTAPSEVVPVRRTLSAGEIYNRALASTVFIDALNGQGEKAGTGSGFVIGPDLVATAFEVIDGAATLRVRFSTGRQAMARSLVAWNRRDDWAILDVETGTTPQAVRAPVNSWAVGDTCYVLDSPAEGTRTIGQVDLVGTQNPSTAGRRLNLSSAVNSGTVGGALMNEYGEVIGVLGGALMPGGRSRANTGFYFGSGSGASQIMQLFSNSRATPIDMVSLQPARRATLEEMLQSGQFIPLLATEKNVTYGTLSKGMNRTGGIPVPVGEGTEFTRRDGRMFVQVRWNPQEKRKALAVLRLYDIENRLVAQEGPAKLDMKPARGFMTDGALPIASLPPGVYRVDVYLDQEVVWRAFFRIVE